MLAGTAVKTASHAREMTPYPAFKTNTVPAARSSPVRISYPRSNVEMLPGIQGAEGDTHAKADGGTYADDEKDFRQQAAVGVVQEINAGSQNDRGRHQDQADGAENSDTGAINVACFLMIFPAERIGHVGKDRPGKAEVEKAVVADEGHCNGPDSILFRTDFVQR